MFKKVIVGDDGLAGGADALALARAIAPGAELILASAYPWDATPSRFIQLGYGNLLREDTKKSLRHRAEASGVPGIRTVAIADSSPARALHHLAESEHADLVVTGTASHGKLGRMLLGDVSRDVLLGSPCPVAVAPRGFSAGTPATIGVAFDHTPEAVKALELALDLAETHAASLTVREVVAADLLPAIAGYPVVDVDEISAEFLEDARQRLEARIADLDTEASITCEAVMGPTGRRLADLADDVDLVVCGSRGWGALRRVVLGSTANRLIHHAAVPVLVVPRTAEAGAAPAAEAATSDLQEA
jgi:nucleotide-binding universal stress UspA family protein